MLTKYNPAKIPTRIPYIYMANLISFISGIFSFGL